LSDPYVYPGSKTLRNLHGITDPDELVRVESNWYAWRALELFSSPLDGRFDTDHLRSIHRYLFQDVYGWAGEFRSINISRRGSFWFARVEFIRPSLDAVAEKLKSEDYLAGLGRPEMAERVAFHLAEINAVHPFRDGNGRTQREFFRELALRAGWAIEWRGVEQSEIYEASARSFTSADHSGLTQTVLSTLRPATPQEMAVAWRPAPLGHSERSG